jgi:hypothetical protein
VRRMAWTDKVDNDSRPPRMKKPVVTPSAHRVYKLYIQDLLHDILVDKYGTKRGTENWEYFVDKGGGAYFAVGQQIQDEKAQMYLDLGERPPSDYFAETYFQVWKRWMARPMKPTVPVMARELMAVARAMVAMPRRLKCVSPGRVEVVVGEARSADVKAGDIFIVARENPHRYFGTLDIRGSMFRHDPGLSGKPVRPGLQSPGDMEFAILKENVDSENMGRYGGFWAQWAVLA